MHQEMQLPSCKLTSPLKKKGTFEDDLAFPQMGYVGSSVPWRVQAKDF